MSYSLLLGNDNRITLTGLSDADGTYQNVATVEVTLVDAGTGAEVAGQIWPLPLSYVSSSNGDYQGVLSKDLAVSEYQSVLALCTVVAGGLTASWKLPVTVDERNG